MPSKYQLRSSLYRVYVNWYKIVDVNSVKKKNPNRPVNISYTFHSNSSVNFSVHQILSVQAMNLYIPMNTIQQCLVLPGSSSTDVITSRNRINFIRSNWGLGLSNDVIYFLNFFFLHADLKFVKLLIVIFFELLPLLEYSFISLKQTQDLMPVNYPFCIVDISLYKTTLLKFPSEL